MDNTQLIKELKDCISLHLNPYNLGDMGKTVQLITEACNRLQNDGKPLVSGSLRPDDAMEFCQEIKYTLSCYDTYGTSDAKLFEDISKLVKEYSSRRH